MTQTGIIRTVPEEGGFYDPPATVIEDRHITPINAFYKHCSDCGVLAWDVDREARIPRPGRAIYCWNCGTDNGRPALSRWERLTNAVSGRLKAWH